MKKSRLARRQGFKARPKGLKRTPIKPVSKKQREKNREGKAILQEFAETHLSCACCGFREGQLDGSLECHHILGGRDGRKHDRRNLLRLCKQWSRPGCHYLVDGPSNGWPQVTLGLQLTLKAECDGEHYDESWLRETRGRALPEPEQLPEVFKAERKRNLFGR